MNGTTRFADKVAVVTGAASGIGAATAERLAAEGAAVILADIAEGPGESAAAGIRAQGGRALFVRADVADEGDWERIVAAARTFGPVGVLVSNAYTVDVTAAHEMSVASWERQLAVNLTGAFLGFRAVLPDLRERRGAVVLTSSVHAHKGIPGHPAYAASKGALLSLCGQLAVEYGPEVRVNAVLPGPILTAAWDRVSEEDRDRSVTETAAQRFGTPQEAAAAIAFLAADEASYITGSSLLVDGGWSVVKASA
ncbi:MULTISPECIES: SDR family NAD(P)-dependent oxidoreductase [unclassified Streptomyces]|uniref:SDR family NAD(P)-dependent oxidoreductase n=1 Tax=Streptomyces TaxID=1883 RepID=UPI0001C19D76|nr:MULTISPECIES: SDR family NAD(P)-dependent oxidoreductase [unclassified Streptomyces]AEN13796.1 short-chain dehydrogenase/reductase SDR [Streptomyces sp. SirexAA-E]MYR67145.1 glucose 1-dehydrogenase [Streptomyces sp. SID4939]MYR99297.1 glucose 1-dehydrogenase [Streptomyces sp. SID4940]MYT67685.1 glucose 1-dehydrogenase [Streptomyces sp. SID8357]MYT86529.1 glucose 1-dehydrogenase [Streptomyces sp. SID8360]